MADHEFLVVTAAASHGRDWHRLRRHIPDSAHCFATDVTGAYAVLGLMGPLARAVLAAASDDDVSDAAHPFRTSREIAIGFARVRVTRISYVGELGWELYVPVEFALHVFDRLVAVGTAHGMRLAGYHAMNSLRIEKAFCHWGHDIDSDTTPLESGLGFTIAWDKPGDWLGREAMLRQRQDGVRRRLVQFRLDDSQAMLFHDEPIWRNGLPAGRVTSAMFGHTVGAAVALGYVSGEGTVNAHWLCAARYEIEVAGTRYPASVSLSPLHDPRGTRMRR